MDSKHVVGVRRWTRGTGTAGLFYVLAMDFVAVRTPGCAMYIVVGCMCGRALKSPAMTDSTGSRDSIHGCEGMLARGMYDRKL